MYPILLEYGIVKRTVYSVTTLVLLLVVILFGVVFGAKAEGDSSNWLTFRPQGATKTGELTPDTEPLATGYDCTPLDFKTGLQNDGQERHGCAITTALGTIAAGFIVKGMHGTLTLNQLNNLGGTVISSPPGRPTTIMSAHVASSGGYGAQELRVSTYDPGMFIFRELWGTPTIYEYQYTPVSAKTLTDATNKPIPLLARSIAYSNNGEWMAIARADGGIMRFDTKIWTGKLIAWDSNYSYAETKATNFAISDSGQYVAVNTNIGSPTNKQPSLRVYDVDTCSDQSAFQAGSTAAKPCAYNDIWNGIAQGKTYGNGLKQLLPGAEYPRHIRFVDDSTISFYTIYDRSSSTTYKVASYQISSGVHIRPSFDLLALGDSYISGEGAFNYRDGTDTSSNKCHNSLSSYPYLLGIRITTTYGSVACSGATTDDITNNDTKYLNQLNPREVQGNINPSQKTSILNQFTPGNINQLQFIKGYAPIRVLVSIGGNNIHFSDIVKLCVMSTGDDSCFDSATERKALLQFIYDQHGTLVKTYTDILQTDPGVKLYVVGYPQIAKVGGNCGLNVHLNTNEVEFGSLLITRLNQTIKHAAEAAGARYVDVENALAGSLLCEPGARAVNGLTAGDDALLGMLANESYHPTAFGHTLLANAISRRTDNLTEAMPTPTHANQLMVDSTDSFITDAKQPGGLLRKLTFDSLVAEPNMLFRTARLHFDTSTLGIKTGTAYRIVFHSQEVQVAYGTIPAGGVLDMDITVPKLDPGTHTLHMYTQNDNGEDIDIMQVVYVAASETDYDADGIPNAADSCPTVPNSGLDTDGDGIDDACDGDTAALAVPTTDSTPSTASKVSSNQASGATSAPVQPQASGSTPALQSPQEVLADTVSNSSDKTQAQIITLKRSEGTVNWWPFVDIAILLLLGTIVFAAYRIHQAK